MPRQARIVIPHEAHHITQRGNYGLDVFDRDSNYQYYIELINEYASDHGVEILAYCLMTNHVHFIVIPKTENGLGKFFNTVHMRYAHYINRQRKVKGHLWQGRFYSCVLDEAHTYRGIRYVEKNPARAKMVKNAWEYPWSSARQHMGMDTQRTIGLSKRYRYLNQGKWKDYLKENDEEMNNEIRKKTVRGLVVGKDDFVAALEKRLNRSLAYRAWGRPKSV